MSNKHKKTKKSTVNENSIGFWAYSKREWLRNRRDSGTASWLRGAIRRSDDFQPEHGSVKILVQNGVILSDPKIIPINVTQPAPIQR